MGLRAKPCDIRHEALVVHSSSNNHGHETENDSCTGQHREVKLENDTGDCQNPSIKPTSEGSNTWRFMGF